MDWVPPSEWPAGKRVNTFLQAYLENCILAPLDSPAAPPRVALSALGIDFAAHLQAADLPTERALYNNAAGLCDMLGRLLDEREAAQAALFNAHTGGYAINPLDAPAYAVSGHYSWNLERERKRSQRQQESQARLKSLDKRSAFVASQLQNWAARTPRYRQAVQMAAINVNAAQIRFDREQSAASRLPVQPVVANPAPAPVQPTVAPAPAVVANPAPTPVPAPAPLPVATNTAPPPPGISATPLPDWPDPVIGPWRLDGNSQITLGADYTITGDRGGVWYYTCTTNAGRNYELHWSGKHSWVDYLVLSSDGKTVGGKSRNKAVLYWRP